MFSHNCGLYTEVEGAEYNEIQELSNECKRCGEEIDEKVMKVDFYKYDINVKIHTEGSKKVLVPLEGGPGARGSIRFLHDVVDCDVAYYDYFGIGDTTKKYSGSNTDLYNMDFLAKELNSVLQSLEKHYDTIILYGSSFGSMLALDHEEKHNMCDGIFMKSTLYDSKKASQYARKKAEKVLSEEELEKIDNADSKINYYKKGMHKFMDEYVIVNEKEKRTNDVGINNKMYEYMWGNCEWGVTEDSELYDWSVNPSRVRTKSCIVAGEKDHFIDMVKETDEKLPNSELHVIENSGHSLTGERPKKHDKILNDFISRV